jgi:hypothetical protein
MLTYFGEKELRGYQAGILKVIKRFFTVKST